MVGSPTLTIAIPVYERTFGFEEALRSALAVKECFEVLVVDDGSKHKEFEKICSKNTDPRVRYEKASRNAGIFGNWNRCAQLAKGDFITILCSDDIIEPDIYTRFSKALQQDPNIDVFFGSFVTLNEATKETKVIRSFPAGPVSAKWLLEDAAENGPGFPVLTVTKREKLLQFPFVENPHSGNDWLWIYSNASNFKLYADAKPLSFWRRHPNQDAKKSEAITTDCWPMMYANIIAQLKILHSKKVRKARRRAIGVVLTWLLNDKQKNGRWYHRLTGPEPNQNPFIGTAKEIADKNWLLSTFLRADATWPLFYNIGRISRKMKLYYPIF